ncbi:hypothetical protein [Gluconobacter cerinus]|uniref:Uncharacterized protein n=1 Tax=Gluconobacter cerinus TaxID=38307 RepID=A0A1B6VKK3_9PROT|nr:hypothetical protein [Gluconobacter cerinus]OAJ67740.1 hypothetical protein A0123_01782 [Gluconobacter cerinus]
MSEAKFTPAPWIAKKGTGWFVTRPNARMAHVVGMSPKTSLVGAENEEEDEARANAHLIAAAPELYEALRMAANDLNTAAHFLPDTRLALLETVKQAHAALAKARGEA